MKWWGYIHINGSVKVKTFFDNESVWDAEESPHVASVIYPFEADTEEEVAEIVKKLLQKELGGQYELKK